MEQDRYEKNHKLFIVGIISLLISLALLAFSFYMLPSLLFGWMYDTPEFIMFWKTWLQNNYDFTEPAASKLILLFLFGVSVIFVAIAYFSSNRIDNQIFNNELQDINKSVKPEPEEREGLSLGLKILFIIISVFIVGALFEWAIYTAPPQTSAVNTYVTSG